MCIFATPGDTHSLTETFGGSDICERRPSVLLTPTHVLSICPNASWLKAASCVPLCHIWGEVIHDVTTSKYTKKQRMAHLNSYFIY